MPKPGDKKDSRKCGTNQSAVYTRTMNDAAFVPDQYAWICSVWGDEERDPRRPARAELAREHR
jgi:hypothetical protein